MIRTGDAKETLAQAMLVEAVRDATLDSCPRATQLAKQALALSREQANVVQAANVYAACGQASEAQALVSDLINRFPLDTLQNANSVAIIRAQVELKRGNGAPAIQALESARKYESFGDFWPQYLRGQAYLQNKNGAQATIEFTRWPSLDWRAQPRSMATSQMPARPTRTSSPSGKMPTRPCRHWWRRARSTRS